jgi:hypothetical protein
MMVAVMLSAALGATTMTARADVTLVQNGAPRAYIHAAPAVFIGAAHNEGVHTAIALFA